MTYWLRVLVCAVFDHRTKKVRYVLDDRRMAYVCERCGVRL